MAGDQWRSHLRHATLGAWLAINGEAIFGTRPWHTAEGETNQGIGVRFTQKADALYAVLLGTPQGKSVRLSGLQASPDMKASLLDLDTPLNWRQEDDGITVSFPSPPQNGPALVLKLAPQPVLLAG